MILIRSSDSNSVPSSSSLSSLFYSPLPRFPTSSTAVVNIPDLFPPPIANVIAEGYLLTPHRPIHHLVGAIVFIIALPPKLELDEEFEEELTSSLHPIASSSSPPPPPIDAWWTGWISPPPPPPSPFPPTRLHPYIPRKHILRLPPGPVAVSLSVPEKQWTRTREGESQEGQGDTPSGRERRTNARSVSSN